MSKVKSVLGDVVDFEMMRIMEEYGATNISTVTPARPTTTTVNPAALVIDNIAAQVSIIGRPEYISSTVPVTEQIIELVVEPQITIVEPETATKNVKPATKKGEI
jgi:hypothetical protein